MIDTPKSILNLLRKPLKIVSILDRLGAFNRLSDRLYLKLIFRAKMGRKLNINTPVTYNEKIQWLKLHDRKPVYTRYVDKYAVRSYIKEMIGEEYLIPLLGVYHHTKEIPWDTLPDKFVLKCTHGSGFNIICENKGTFDKQDAIRKLNKWMKKNWYWTGREWPYKNVKPRIICETFLSVDDHPPDDLKVMCFNGKAKLIRVHMNKYSNHKVSFYDTEWKKTNVEVSPTSDKPYAKPAQLDTMIQLSEKLAADMKLVRIDWYIVHNTLYFGEITLYDGSGFKPFDDYRNDLLLGSWINLD